MSTQKKIRFSVMMGLLAVLFAAMAVRAQDKVTLRYGLWDASQQPQYQDCATLFATENPNIEIKVEQIGWSAYWTGISTGFVSGNAPDVFTNHLAKYPEFVTQEQLVDIQPLVDRDQVPTDIYYPGLADLWTKDGKRYGLPKDWDTVAVVYNVEMLKAAGIDPAIMKSDDWTWNPKDGGKFEEVIAKLTLDAKGNNGLSPDFDKNNVVQYGWATSGTGSGVGSGYGQTEWSWLAVANGFKFNNGVWGNEYYYDDPKFAETIQWLFDLWLKKGYAPKIEDQTSLGRTALFQSKKVAMTADGSWMISTYLGSDFSVGFGRLPIGAEGRKSMFNGLADSIWVGSQHQEEAWQWVKFLASQPCEDIVGKAGVVFPAIPSSVEISLKVRADKGIDISAFTDQANEEGGTFLFPITDHASEINTIMGETMDRIALGQEEAATALAAANEEVNALFK